MVITGALTNVCCQSSARDAATAGLRVLMVADAKGRLRWRRSSSPSVPTCCLWAASRATRTFTGTSPACPQVRHTANSSSTP
ncbi:isochorismatase family protein [Streptomyces sp. CB02460]|uniref:isochorismatase family protein n=1 Tax=Streptomyces sp. CB02460 TaxID=1703941 RepID=UPI0023782F73|nr:isochorismatase family protein [Streptomyces sp. CB02460]